MYATPTDEEVYANMYDPEFEPPPRACKPKKAYVVSTTFSSGKRFAVDMVTDDGTTKTMEMAKESARRYRDAGWKEVKLSRVHGDDAIEKAEDQIERVEDWASDGEN